MQICADHWAKIRKAIDDRGLTHLVAKTGEEAHASMVADLQGEDRPYDPLMDCNWMITSMALDVGGLVMLTNKDDGTPRCPICEAVSHGVPEAEWINGPADAALGLCRDKGLVPPVQ